MDPDTTYSLLRDALDRGDYSAASQLACDLSTWLRNGGFWPTVADATAVRTALRLAWHGAGI